jgi:hypothetical protein
MAKTATQLLRRLMTKADLSNQVSAIALLNARQTWSDYVDTPDNQRDWTDVQTVLTELSIIVKQICAGDCRINPETRKDLADLVTMLRHSMATGEILEPKPIPMPMPEPANDDDDGKEAA